MDKNFRLSVFVFRRDLRLDDNTALINALEISDLVIPIFILDPRQVSSDNKFRSLRAIKFMLESILDLNSKLEKLSKKLYIFYGDPLDVLNRLSKQLNFDAIFVNRDYTPFSIKRDKLLKKLCLDNNIVFESYDDLLLNNPDNIKKKDGTSYSIFTPYYKASSFFPVEKPKTNRYKNYYSEEISVSEDISVLKKIDQAGVIDNSIIGGRDFGLKILASINDYKDYKNTHDIVSMNTTRLSPHNKFGTVSIREVYFACKNNIALTRQLYWRDFFTYVAYHNPKVFGNPFHDKYKKLKWDNNKKLFKLWQDGLTGFPIVDAGMRQLKKTGYMHNRARLIVGSFLVKDLYIDWQWGEKYFAQELIDYDPCVNNGNWQWVASTGCDATPYFRIFNPWLQQKKFDKDCKYIKEWLPELRDVSVQSIHNWDKAQLEGVDYPAPILEHKSRVSYIKSLYKKVN